MSVTSPLAPLSTNPGPDPVEWRCLARDLWVGRRNGRHAGTVERGRRYFATGPDGESLGTYCTLQQAMDAVADPERRNLTAPASASWSGVLFVGIVTVAAALLLTAYGLLLV